MNAVAAGAIAAQHRDITPTPSDSETARWFSDEVKPHESTLRGYLHGMAGTADIDDVVQETYLRLCRARARTVVRSTRALLFTTARNVARDLFRRRAVAKTVPETDVDVRAFADERPLAPELVSRAQELELLEAAIATLPPRCRLVLDLRRREGLSQKEIAARLAISAHTVEAQLRKALQRCEEYFAEHGALRR
jgi:RNA polymerase sigma factor (sigma-70 family)